MTVQIAQPNPSILSDGENMLIKFGDNNVTKLHEPIITEYTASIPNNIESMYMLDVKDTIKFPSARELIDVTLTLKALKVTHQEKFELDPKKLTYYERIIMEN